MFSVGVWIGRPGAVQVVDGGCHGVDSDLLPPVVTPLTLSAG